ncbi:DNA polymerase [Telmatospirillum sp. J64-1]|uniref:DNA polymerase n=1 Tax=Telmatospirillum sp. J64-1 TaxID=2502183 RepID=UPI001C8F704D|nr:DNA polymerase [Telmatospirillum sp. J64-1]
MSCCDQPNVRPTGNSTIHCGVQPTNGYHPIEEGLRALMGADLIAGHNIIKYDIPALQKVYPWFKPKGVIRDTLVMARLIYPKDDLRERDFKLQKKGTLPGNMIGRYTLEAWGRRLGNYKGDFKGPWDRWSETMQSYCEQDVEVTLTLWNRLVAKNWPEDSIELEHQVQHILWRQEQHGFLFDQERASKLFAKLVQRKTELDTELKQAFGSWWRVLGEITPLKSIRYKDPKKPDLTEGATYTKIERVHFNPASRDHIAQRLRAVRGWEPTEKTPDGKDKVDETILSSLPWPEAKLLTEYLTVDKRLGQLSTGNEAWLRHVRADGRIHGEVITNGALTGRMTHSKPNMAQVPSSGSPYGHDCRELFTVPKGKRLVGCDADALELRCLAGYMAKYDQGEYVKVVLEGDKSKGTDIHSVNCRALGMDPKQKYPVAGKDVSGRDIAKVWFYAFIYGAGDEKLGLILGHPQGKEAIEAGQRSRARFLKNLPALGKVITAVKDRVQGNIRVNGKLLKGEERSRWIAKNGKPRTYLKGLDGRRLKCRSAHSAFNTLLQSAGAVLMKRALVILDQGLQAAGFTPGLDYEFVANVHDEWQIEVNEEIADDVGRTAVSAIRKAGESFSFGCPLDGQYQVGNSWAETH